MICFIFIKHADLYNYADDNTLCYQHKDVNVLQDILMSDSATGVTFDQNFTFDSHVRYICSRVSKQVNVLQRIGNILDLNSRLCIYNAFISSQFKYCPLIWHFCGKNLSDKLEKLQIRALRFVYQDLNSKTEDLLAKSHHSSLHVQRIHKL